MAGALGLPGPHLTLPWGRRQDRRQHTSELEIQRMWRGRRELTQRAGTAAWSRGPRGGPRSISAAGAASSVWEKSQHLGETPRWAGSQVCQRTATWKERAPREGTAEPTPQVQDGPRAASSSAKGSQSLVGVAGWTKGRSRVPAGAVCAIAGRRHFRACLGHTLTST